MGTYHENAQAVYEGHIGRRLEDLGDTYESYTDQLSPGEQLWLATHNGGWALAILLDSANEFQHVNRSRGGKAPYVYYAIPAS